MLIAVEQNATQLEQMSIKKRAFQLLLMARFWYCFVVLSQLLSHYNAKCSLGVVVIACLKSEIKREKIACNYALVSCVLCCVNAKKGGKGRSCF